MEVLTTLLGFKAERLTSAATTDTRETLMANTKFWIVTREISDPHQDREDLVDVFSTQPDFNALSKLLPEQPSMVIDRLIRGGGREHAEGEWFNLIEVTLTLDLR